jgi:hypothetical protein
MISRALTRFTPTVTFTAVRFLSLGRLSLNMSEVCLRYDLLLTYISFTFYM